MSAAEVQPTPKLVSHTISLFVHDRPGVLVRVALVFARRGYNIESLVVSPSAAGGYSRMTITCSGDPDTLDQIIRQLAKLVDVVSALDHTGPATEAPQPLEHGRTPRSGKRPGMATA